MAAIFAVTVVMVCVCVWHETDVFLCIYCRKEILDSLEVDGGEGDIDEGIQALAKVTKALSKLKAEQAMLLKQSADRDGEKETECSPPLSFTSLGHGNGRTASQASDFEDSFYTCPSSRSSPTHTADHSNLDFPAYTETSAAHNLSPSSTLSTLSDSDLAHLPHLQQGTTAEEDIGREEGSVPMPHLTPTPSGRDTPQEVSQEEVPARREEMVRPEEHYRSNLRWVSKPRLVPLQDEPPPTGKPCTLGKGSVEVTSPSPTKSGWRTGPHTTFRFGSSHSSFSPFNDVQPFVDRGSTGSSSVWKNVRPEPICTPAGRQQNFRPGGSERASAASIQLRPEQHISTVSARGRRGGSSAQRKGRRGGQRNRPARFSGRPNQLGTRRTGFDHQSHKKPEFTGRRHPMEQDRIDISSSDGLSSPSELIPSLGASSHFPSDPVQAGSRDTRATGGRPPQRRTVTPSKRSDLDIPCEMWDTVSSGAGEEVATAPEGGEDVAIAWDKEEPGVLEVVGAARVAEDGENSGGGGGLEVRGKIVGLEGIDSVNGAGEGESRGGLEAESPPNGDFDDAVYKEEVCHVAGERGDSVEEERELEGEEAVSGERVELLVAAGEEVGSDGGSLLHEEEKLLVEMRGGEIDSERDSVVQSTATEQQNGGDSQKEGEEEVAAGDTELTVVGEEGEWRALAGVEEVEGGHQESSSGVVEFMGSGDEASNTEVTITEEGSEQTDVEKAIERVSGDEAGNVELGKEMGEEGVCGKEEVEGGGEVQKEDGEGVGTEASPDEADLTIVTEGDIGEKATAGEGDETPQQNSASDVQMEADGDQASAADANIVTENGENIGENEAVSETETENEAKEEEEEKAGDCNEDRQKGEDGAGGQEVVEEGANVEVTGNEDGGGVGGDLSLEASPDQKPPVASRQVEEVFEEVKMTSASIELSGLEDWCRVMERKGCSPDPTQLVESEREEVENTAELKDPLLLVDLSYPEESKGVSASGESGVSDDRASGAVGGLVGVTLPENDHKEEEEDTNVWPLNIKMNHPLDNGPADARANELTAAESKAEKVAEGQQRCAGEGAKAADTSDTQASGGEVSDSRMPENGELSPEIPAQSCPNPSPPKPTTTPPHGLPPSSLATTEAFTPKYSLPAPLPALPPSPSLSSLTVTEAFTPKYPLSAPLPALPPSPSSTIPLSSTVTPNHSPTLKVAKEFVPTYPHSSSLPPLPLPSSSSPSPYISPPMPSADSSPSLSLPLITPPPSSPIVVSPPPSLPLVYPLPPSQPRPFVPDTVNVQIPPPFFRPDTTVEWASGLIGLGRGTPANNPRAFILPGYPECQPYRTERIVYNLVAPTPRHCPGTWQVLETRPQ